MVLYFLKLDFPASDIQVLDILRNKPFALTYYFLWWELDEVVHVLMLSAIWAFPISSWNGGNSYEICMSQPYKTEVTGSKVIKRWLKYTILLKSMILTESIPFTVIDYWRKERYQFRKVYFAYMNHIIWCHIIYYTKLNNARHKLRWGGGEVNDYLPYLSHYCYLISAVFMSSIIVKRGELFVGIDIDAFYSRSWFWSVI